MNYKHVLITGGCGFVGSTISLRLKQQYKGLTVSVFDNLSRSGSELNVPRLEASGITVHKGDVRNRDELFAITGVDLIIDCAAEPSVLAGRDGSPLYVTDINLGGTINCLELARMCKADFVFLSTSRVYPIDLINTAEYIEEATRFSFNKKQKIQGLSDEGIREDFSLQGVRSLYGATKLSSEFIIQEFCDLYGIKAVINRCGVIAGPWQFGKIDQGVAVLWMARHIFKKNLSYIGYGGTGKQARDMLHVDDLYTALSFQIEHMDLCNKQIFNLGGGRSNSLSLQELTRLCEKISGNSISITPVLEDRPGDIKVYITDYSKFNALSGWKPQKTNEMLFTDIYNWITENKAQLEAILN